MSNATPEFELSREVDAARLLIQQLKEIGEGDDDQLIADTIEGELNLQQVIEAVVKSIVEEDEVLIEGINKARATLEIRRKSAETRIDRKRALILTAMQLGKIPKLVTPHRTVSVKVAPTSLTIVDEAQIPSQFWERPEPVPQKRKMLDILRGLEKRRADALKLDDPDARQRELDDIAASQIPGVELSAPAETVQLR